MVNYGNSKVYKIEPNIDHEEGEIYIGSTTKQYLSQRMDNHRSNYRQWRKNNVINYRFVTSYNLFEKYGLENCQIVLLETCLVNTKDELFLRERHYIKSMKCVNKISPMYTKEDKKNSAKLYRDKNLDKIHENNNKKTKCPCDGSYTHCHQAHHFRTKKHQNYVANNPIDPEVPIDV